MNFWLSGPEDAATDVDDPECDLQPVQETPLRCAREYFDLVPDHTQR